MITRVLLTWVVMVWPVAAHSDPNDWLAALRGNDIREALALIDAVDDVDLAPEDGRTALMLCAKRGMTQSVRRLLSRGARATMKNRNGGTPLMYGAINGSVEIATLLTEAGADVNHRGSNGWGALMVAAAKGHDELVSWLVSQGADVNAVDVYGWTPLARASFESREAVVAILLRSDRVDVDARDDQGATALHHAATHGDAEIVKLLLDAGATPAVEDYAELTPGDRAEQGEHTAVVDLLKTLIR